MSSGGEQTEGWLRIVRTYMDQFGPDLESALRLVPSDCRDEIRIKWQERNAQRIRPAHVLSAQGGRRSWCDAWDPSAGYYWRRQRAYRIDHLGWSEPEIESLDDSTDKILSHLEDPRPDGPAEFRIQGLVMGYVQSGKTANFSALIAKAADLGYKLVIVLSGIHNTLRQQTQRRLERELGLATDGVGEPEAGRRWVSLTTADLTGDFRPGTINPNVLQGNERVLLVVKKNASVLRRLVGWMAERVPPSVPVLIIDDEADQASINTGGDRPPVSDLVDLVSGDVDAAAPAAPEDEISPSAINRLLRALIRSFGRVSYVGYTATPFANVLINHEAVDREVMEDLYPRDFIISLPRPAGWVGAERLFGRDALPGEDEDVQALDVIDFVPESEIRDLVPDGYDIDSFQPVLCNSLRTAFFDFILGIAARLQRSRRDIPASMLVHTSHRTLAQNRLGDLVRTHVTELRQQWRYDRSSIRPQLKEHWNRRFRPVIAWIDARRDVTFETIEDYIDRLFRDPLAVVVLNSSSDDVLDYQATPFLKAVLVGGNRLSRGLTLEGLLVSYYVRSAPYFDTLLQMGRWFGFREDYVDLTRLWTTAELAAWFHDLAFAEEALRREIERYEREKLTPLDFGPRIRTHPVMQVTSTDKMGAARSLTLSFARDLVQTTMFRLDDIPWLEHNLGATREFLSRLGNPTIEDDACPTWSGINWREIDRFLSEYWSDPRASLVDVSLIRRYINEQVRHGELTRWWVSLRALPSKSLDTEDIGISGVGRVNNISRTRLRSNPCSIGSLVSPATVAGRPGAGDEEVGLSEEQILAARTSAADKGVRLGDALREQRSKEEGLLLIYPISRYSTPRPGATARVPLFDNPDQNGLTVIGLALAFPDSSSPATDEYVVGSVGELSRDEN